MEDQYVNHQRSHLELQTETLLKIEILLLKLAVKYKGKATCDAGAGFRYAARIVELARKGEFPDEWNDI